MEHTTMRCMSACEERTARETLECYHLTPKQVERAMQLVEQRAMDTSLPFSAYLAAHHAGATIVRNEP